MDQRDLTETSRPSRFQSRQQRAAQEIRKLMPLKQLIEHKRRQAAALHRSLNSGFFSGEDLRSAQYAHALFEAQLSKLEAVLARIEKEPNRVSAPVAPRSQPMGASSAGIARIVPQARVVVVGHRIRKSPTHPNPWTVAIQASVTSTRKFAQWVEKNPLLAWGSGILALLASSVALWR